MIGFSNIRNDGAGLGHFGASRGSRTHNGIDIVKEVGSNVYAPEMGYLKREASPYKDSELNGFVFMGLSGIEYKTFYAKAVGVFGEIVPMGKIIGKAQDVKGYHDSTAMINHIHVETRIDGTLVNPVPVLKKK